ncbi:phosphoribosyl-AMP cyclohydrolase [Epibacterium sp. SM1969]|uniref:Phosphoribosyl-AMP cyclohydrolase n=1 Tax=Tritonibacter aquimaris TaxID=2663379 RepID=A0A844AZM8_9RHOB|nr:phosphoribosyl-AMP cyclohydrolase [Tritonibacter aquimaris]MQY43381.1 phosphoribosyl-AMP cyclohydrolase [Tritonibacter aquimaris]
MTFLKPLTAAAFVVLVSGAASAEAISKQEVIDAQLSWGKGIEAIAATHKAGGDFESLAKEHIDTLYAYGLSDVMFKPTLASQKQFRADFDGALSYFIGSAGSEDKGFAIKGWTKVRWENNGIYTSDDTAMAMGNYYFTGPDGVETKVEFSFGYIKDENGELKINLHHSSLPYSPS